MHTAGDRRTEEAELVAKARAGEPAALGRLLEDARPRLRSLCRRALGSSPDVDDIVQETLLEAFPLILNGRFDPARGALSAWLARFALRACCDYLKRERYRKRAVPLFEADGRGVEIEGRLLIVLELERCLEKLGEAERDAFVLVAMDELSYEEAAKALECAAGTLGSRRNRAAKLLKRCMESRLFSEDAKPPEGR